jgi:hypothetical protein
MRCPEWFRRIKKLYPAASPFPGWAHPPTTAIEAAMKAWGAKTVQGAYNVTHWGRGGGRTATVANMGPMVRWAESAFVDESRDLSPADVDHIQAMRSRLGLGPQQPTA